MVDDEADADVIDEEPTDEDGRTYTKADLSRIVRERLKKERAAMAEFKAKAAKFDELDALSKSDLERESAARTKAEQELATARHELLRVKVATAKGLPPDLAARLQGSTEAELAKDADELLKLVKPPAGPSTSRPVADLRPGALPAGDSPQTFNADEWIRDRAHRR